MNRTWLVALGLALCGCGVSRPEYDAKVREADTAKQQAEAAKKQLADLQQQTAGDNQQITDLKNQVGLAQSQAITDDQKAQLEEAKRAVQEAQERGKLLEDLRTKFKRMIDAGHLKVTTRHGRAVLQLHNDVLFDPGEADVKPAGKQALVEVAATLRSVGGRRFQVAGHTDAEPLTPATKKKYPSNWELSAARAISVVKLLVESGVAPGELSAAGYGP
ncbi:MAG TPA: OmpA family protein, partial [Polyangiaceae bacterium]|nr:OmpA family protein [Polyangiaceae bacterium]